MFDSFYRSFVTDTTVGYADLHSVNRTSRIVAILMAIMGLTFTGIIIAVAVLIAVPPLPPRVLSDVQLRL